MTAPKIVTSKPEFQSFSDKAIGTLLDDIKKRNDGEARFVEEMHFFSVNLKGYTGDITAAIFWTEKLPPHIPNAQHFFGFYWRGNGIVVCGLPTFDPVIDAVLVKESNTIIYSRAQHDFFYDPSGTVAVDGGREYRRIVGNFDAYECVKVNLLTKQFKRNRGKWRDVG